MANRRFTGKESEQSDFIYVDLLPHMRRPRQFNVNIILIVLIAVAATWLLIYWPLSGRQEMLDDALNRNNDLQIQRDLIDEQIAVYRIDEDRITLMENIDTALEHQLEVMEYRDDLLAAIHRVESGASIKSLNVDISANTITLRVELTRNLSYENVNIEFLELPFVKNSTYDDSGLYTLEVHI